MEMIDFGVLPTLLGFVRDRDPLLEVGPCLRNNKRKHDSEKDSSDSQTHTQHTAIESPPSVRVAVQIMMLDRSKRGRGITNELTLTATSDTISQILWWSWLLRCCCHDGDC